MSYFTILFFPLPIPSLVDQKDAGTVSREAIVAKVTLALPRTTSLTFVEEQYNCNVSFKITA
ncbi:MAG: hypothetical protein ACRC6O_03920 [Flavobacterium sp.]